MMLFIIKPKLKLIELIPNNHGSIKCERISKLLKFEYTRIDLDPIKPLHRDGDIKIEIKELEKILNSINLS